MTASVRSWWRRWPGLLIRWLLLIPAGLYAGYAFLLYEFQDVLMFPAPDISDADLSAWAERVGATELRIEREYGGQVLGWHLPGKGEHVVVHFHGNGDAVTAATGLRRVVPEDWDVIGFTYPGYPGSPGRTTEATLQEAARLAWEHVTRELDFPERSVVLHGRSLGGSVAAMAAEGHTPAGLVLESTFLSMEQVAGEQHPLAPVSLLIQHPLRTDLRLPHLDAPVLVLHSADDELIPVHHGRGLAGLTDDATYVERAGYGHNAWLVVEDEAARAAYLAFLEEVTAGGSE